MHVSNMTTTMGHVGACAVHVLMSMMFHPTTLAQMVNGAILVHRLMSIC